MKALTVRQPWAWAIIHGGKNIENRSRNIAGKYRGAVAIHAGKTWDRDGGLDVRIQHIAFPGAGRLDAGAMGFLGVGFERGAIIGVADLVGVHRNRTDALTTVCFDDHTPSGRTCSGWAEQFDRPGGFHLVLANPRPCEPIPCRGALGLWTVPADIETRIGGTQ